MSRNYCGRPDGANLYASISSHRWALSNICYCLRMRSPFFLQNYDWNIVNSGIDKRKSLLTEPRTKVRNQISHNKKAPSPKPKPGPGPNADESMRELSGLMTGMKLVPRNIRFGRR
jgi:hypothetical protein